MSRNADILGLGRKSQVKQDDFLRSGQTNTYNRAMPADNAPLLTEIEQLAVNIRTDVHGKHGTNSTELRKALRQHFPKLTYAERVLQSADRKLKIRARMGLE